MSQEIIYTSAPQGLKPGSRGFCTVVSTAGMATNLAERLETLSGYAHPHAALKFSAALNPVNHSHLLLTVGGRRYHVLSRVADAGVDYTRRTNKLAHHVVLEAGEIGLAGPAWVLSEDGFCVEAWDGRVEIMPQGRRPRMDAYPGGFCKEWKRLTGDAGWAGVLAASASDEAKPLTVIFPVGKAMLPLVVEAMNLLPPQQQWKVTFSTYWTKLTGSNECQWRFVLDGTQEARLARNNPHASVIDLCRRGPTTANHPLVLMAREGTGGSASIPNLLERAVRTAKAEKPKPDVPEPNLVEPFLGQTPPATAEYPLRGSDISPPLSTARRALSTAPTVQRKSATKHIRTRHTTFNHVVIGIAVASLVLFIFAGLWWGLNRGNRVAALSTEPVTAPAQEAPAAPTEQPPTVPPKEMSAKKVVPASEPPAVDPPPAEHPDPYASPTSRPSEASAEIVEPATSPAPKTAESTSAPAPMASTEPSPPENLKELEALLAETHNVLVLPDCQDDQLHHLAWLRLADKELTGVSLHLLGTAQAFDRNPDGKDNLRDDDLRRESDLLQWRLAIPNKGTTANNGKAREFATIQLSRHSGPYWALGFGWLDQQQENRLLQYCMLKLKFGEKTVCAQLLEPERSEAKALKLDKGDDVLWDVSRLEYPKSLVPYLKFELRVAAGRYHKAGVCLSEGSSPEKLQFMLNSEPPDVFAEIDCLADFAEGRPGEFRFQGSCYALGAQSYLSEVENRKTHSLKERSFKNDIEMNSRHLIRAYTKAKKTLNALQVFFEQCQGKSERDRIVALAGELSHGSEKDEATFKRLVKTFILRLGLKTDVLEIDSLAPPQKLLICRATMLALVQYGKELEDAKKLDETELKKLEKPVSGEASTLQETENAPERKKLQQAIAAAQSTLVRLDALVRDCQAGAGEISQVLHDKRRLDLFQFLLDDLKQHPCLDLRVFIEVPDNKSKKQWELDLLRS